MPNYTKLKASRKKAYLRPHPSPTYSSETRRLLSADPSRIKTGKGSRTPDEVIRQDGHPLIHDGYINVRVELDPIHKVLMFGSCFIKTYLCIQGHSIAYFLEVDTFSKTERRSINYGSPQVAKEAINNIEWRT